MKHIIYYVIMITIFTTKTYSEDIFNFEPFKENEVIEYETRYIAETQKKTLRIYKNSGEDILFYDDYHHAFYTDKTKRKLLFLINKESKSPWLSELYLFDADKGYLKKLFRASLLINATPDARFICFDDDSVPRKNKNIPRVSIYSLDENRIVKSFDFQNLRKKYIYLSCKIKYDNKKNQFIIEMYEESTVEKYAITIPDFDIIDLKKELNKEKKIISSFNETYTLDKINNLKEKLISNDNITCSFDNGTLKIQKKSKSFWLKKNVLKDIKIIKNVYSDYVLISPDGVVYYTINDRDIGNNGNELYQYDTRTNEIQKIGFGTGEILPFKDWKYLIFTEIVFSKKNDIDEYVINVFDCKNTKIVKSYNIIDLFGGYDRRFELTGIPDYPFIQGYLAPQVGWYFHTLINVETEKSYWRKMNKQLFGELNDSNVRLRTEPNLDSDVITHLNSGDEVFVLYKSLEKEKIGNMDAHWYMVQNSDNTIEGWVYGWFVDILNE